MAFKKLDKTGDGIVTLEDLKGVYNIQSHPEYQNGQKTEKELLHGFLKKFEEGGSIDGQVGQQKPTHFELNFNFEFDFPVD